MNATAKTMHLLIGREGYVRDRGMNVNVKVLDVRQAYGNVHVLVAPISGSGETWTTIESVQNHANTAEHVSTFASLDAVRS